MPSSALLKFSDNNARLQNQGLELIESLSGPVRPVVFIGEGRAGKSFLASEVSATTDLFASGNSATAVTEGIDVAAMPHPDGGHLLLLDAEGGNNALAAQNRVVNVLAANMTSSIVLVARGLITEESLQNLGSVLAVQKLINHRIPGQDLVFVANKTDLDLGEDSLEQALSSQHDRERTELRDGIAEAFPEGHRLFLAIPDKRLDLGTFEGKIRQLSEVVRRAKPLKLAGQLHLNGAQIAKLIRTTFNDFQVMGQVDNTNVIRSIIFDGFLKPLAKRLAESCRRQLPQLEAYNAELEQQNPVEGTLADFDAQSGHIHAEQLRKEARDWLEARVKADWKSLVQRNEALKEKEDAGREAKRARLEADTQRSRAEAAESGNTRILLQGVMQAGSRFIGGALQLEQQRMRLDHEQTMQQQEIAIRGATAAARIVGALLR